MKKTLQETFYFLQQKIFMIPVLLTMVCCYGFEITHPSIGIDDTMVEGYLEGGIEIVQGRWMNYLADRIFRFGTFTPTMLEIVGVILLFLSVVLFCVLIRRMAGDRVDMTAYTVFACVFMSFPTISELYLYYYHSGEDLGYFFTAIALLLFYDGLTSEGKFWKKDRICYFAASSILLWMAVGCYEAFIILYILAAVLILFGQGLLGQKKITFRYILCTMITTGFLVLFTIILRTVINEILRSIYHVQDLQMITDSRDVMGFMELFASSSPMADFFMLMKKYYLEYFVNGVASLPIGMYALSVIGFLVLTIYLCIRQKNGWYFLLYAGMLLVPFMMAILQNNPPLFRTCQFLPLFVGLAALLVKVYADILFGEEKGSLATVCRYAVYFLLFLQIFRQSFAMNKCFYTDYLKYEYQKDVLVSMAKDVYEEYGRDAKVVIVGDFEIPFELISDSYISFDSNEFKWISRLTDWLDPCLKEKYYSTRGYYLGGEAKYSVISWGFTAYEHPGGELVNFLDMHGYHLNADTDKAVVQQANDYVQQNNLPHWPQKGYISDQGDYIIINL